LRRQITYQFENNSLTIPPPTDEVKEWPLVGERLYSIWSSASSNLEDTIIQYKDQLADFGESFLQSLLSVGSSIFQFMAATIIAGIILATAGKKQVVRK
jgi:hypothetical protein